ncbi:MAG: hypothetical protein JNM34_08440 [Chthonomonadaceae bacterium]|nr:hypothetical protein [Chthonomonadaceae bacterium]
MKWSSYLFLGSGAVFAVCALTIPQASFKGAVAQVLSRSSGREVPAIGSAALETRFIQRLGSAGTMPQDGMARAVAQRAALLREQGSQFASPVWTFLGPNNVGGRIRPIVVHPTNASVMWLGSVGGGIWKTTNSGSSWSPQNDYLPSLCIGTMVINTTNPNVLYAGSGESYFNTSFGENNKAAVQGAGIYKTTDGGTTWVTLSATQNADFNCVSRLAISPSDPQTLLASTNTGIFRTTDGGATWAQVYTGKTYDVDFCPTDSSRAVAGLPSAPGAVYSSDGGLTWSNASGLPTLIRVETHWSKSVAGNVYAAVCNAGAARVWKSTNFGQTWTVKTTGGGQSMYDAYNVALWVDPTNDNNLIIGGVSASRSTNQGATLTSAFGNVHSDWHGVTESSGFNGSTNRTVFFASDGGIFRAADYTSSTVTALNNSLGITQFYGGAVNDTTGRIMAGAQDNFTQVYTGTLNWTGVIGGDGVHCCADPTVTNVFYAGYYYLNLFRDTGSLSFGTDITAGITDRGSATNCNFIPYMVLDPNQPNTMLACGRRLWRSTNVRTGNPPTWTSIKPPIANNPPGEHPWRESIHSDHFDPEAFYNLSYVAVAKSNSNVIYAAHNNGQVYVTTNGSAASPSWSRVDLNGPLPGRWVSCIVVDVNDANHAYVSFMGFASNNIWETTNGGATWRQATGTGLRQIPSAPVSALAIDPLRPGHLIAGTDIGTFTSWDNGTTWSVVTEGPGTVPVDRLDWRNNSQLMSYTYGRGVWQATVSPIPTPVAVTGLNIFRGLLVSGGVSEVQTSDDQYLVVRNGLVLNPNESPVTVDFVGTAPNTIGSSLQLNCEASVTTGGLTRRLQAFNYDTNAWIEVDSRPGLTSDELVQATITTNVSSYIHPTSREVKMRLLVKPGGIVGSATWSAKVDLVSWSLSH